VDIVLAVLALGGGAIRLREGMQAASGALFPAGLDEAATVVLVTTVLVAILQVVELPCSWYQGFRLEHRYGLSTQSGSHWLVDHLKAATVGIALSAAGASIVFLSIREWPDYWWLVSAVVFGVAMVILARLVPVLLLPVFYRFRPLDRPQLVQRLVALAQRAQTDVVGVFEWIVSGHTRKANAALAGLGRTRRILLSDTLLSDYSEDEIEVVLAHELAHHVHRDLWRGIGLQALLMLGGFFAADFLLRRGAESLGYRGLADPAAVALLMLIGRMWSLLVLPLVNALSRVQERAADRYALETTRNPEAFVSAMKRLSQQNLAEDDPSPLVQWIFSSHPPIRERIALARSFEHAAGTISHGA
jgi:STE24 endopeptidase